MNFFKKNFREIDYTEKLLPIPTRYLKISIRFQIWETACYESLQIYLTKTFYYTKLSKNLNSTIYDLIEPWTEKVLLLKEW